MHTVDTNIPVTTPEVVKRQAKPRKKLIAHVSREKYFADPRINISTLVSASKSALQYRYDREHPKKPSASMLLGTAEHMAVFEPDRFLTEHIVWRGARRAGGEWDRFCAEHEGKTILTADDYDHCLAMRSAVRNNRLAAPYLKDGIPEVSLFWAEPTTGMRCKSRVDWLSSSRPAIPDLKTCRDLSRFMNDAARLRYHLKAAFYHDAALNDPAIGADLRPVFIAVESQPPYDVGVFPVTDEVINIGRREYIRLLDLVKYCETSGTWPGAYDSEQELLLPAWACGADADEECELTIGDETVAV